MNLPESEARWLVGDSKLGDRVGHPVTARRLEFAGQNLGEERAVHRMNYRSVLIPLLEYPA